MPMNDKQPKQKKPSNKQCMMILGSSKNDLEKFANEMDEVEIPKESKPECNCGTKLNMDSRLQIYSYQT